MSVFNLFKSKAPAKMETPPNAITVACEVRDFFVFRDVLFGRGYVDRAGGSDPRISVRLWDGTLHPVKHAVDDFNPSTPERCTFCFSLPLTVNTPPEDLAKMTVVFDFPTGRFEKLRVTSDAIAHDAFLTSEADFWAFVHAHPQANVLEIGS
ncbi:MAG TPA: hypothetical protein VII09_06875, partial [Opitutaceae bacterium]